MDAQVLLQTVEEGNIASPEDFKVLCERVADSRNYKVCPGIEVEEYDQYKQVIGYDPKKVRIVDLPVKRIESTKCERWFPLSQSHGVTRKKRENPHVLCRECVQLQRYLRASVQRLSSVTAEDKVKHEQADSYYPLKYLSPESLQRRKMNVKSALAKKNRIMKRSVPKEIILGDKRRAKISLGESSSCKLESTIGEGEQQGTETRSTLRHVLEQDSTQ